MSEFQRATACVQLQFVEPGSFSVQRKILRRKNKIIDVPPGGHGDFQYLMKHQGLKNKDLVPSVFETESVASAVLKGTRGFLDPTPEKGNRHALTKPHIPYTNREEDRPPAMATPSQ